MPTIYFSTHSCHVTELIEGSEENIKRFSTLNKISPSGRLSKGQAYTLDDKDPYAVSIVNILNHSSHQEREWLMSAVETQGEELHRDAAFVDQYLTRDSLEAVIGLIGASNNAVRHAASRLDGFQEALVRYENALLALQNPVPNNMPGAGPKSHWQALARRDAIQAYEKLTAEYRVTMMRLSPAVMRAKNRGTALSNPQRGILLAERSRGRNIDPRIRVADMFQAQRLKGLANWGVKITGPMAYSLDAANRSTKVYSADNRTEEFFAQTGGFVVGGFAGSLTGKILLSPHSIAAVKLKAGGALAGGPIAWILLGCVAVYVVYQVAKIGDNQGKKAGQELYNIIFPAL
ncbi:hypothetical protein ADINL_1955 [Nitrincola lacisaponensis]|uniref:Uncharacterized protein n=1 Tax=Nitrincola lacisaponensis TaxID=267850 RepID=A0A063Y439_9GAMM|nr:hypothetical protein [Nitrincola lacisaponensis]KDE39501.1 hypothetical protein ADINL_1955 [Nitrincola lacisaponensis]